ncbi:MAG: hypothetical protein HDT47_09110 [Ruminococcaceae bacterium]|nr:hypothetical protein [Oscillospiraceae bacterium]
MKKKITPLLLTMSFLLTACADVENSESISKLEMSEISSEESAFFSDMAVNVSETQSTLEKTIYSNTPTESADPITKAAETSENVPETSVSASETTAPKSNAPVFFIENPDEFFDDITPMEYRVFDDEQFYSDDKDAEKAAIQAYKDSDYYKEALEAAKKLCGYENGELVFLEESWKTYYGGFDDFIDKTAAPEIDLKAEIVDSTKARFDGKNEENVFFLAVALPDSCFVSSGDPANFVVPVYVNCDGKAFILDSAGYQAGISVSFVQYEKTGKIHLISNGAHSEGTMRTAIFSFENGQPKEELYTYGAVETIEKNGRVFEWHTSYWWCCFIFYSEELSRYCGIKAVPVTENMAETICSDKSILEKVPDIRERYENGDLGILGGKYFFVYGGETFEYDGIGFVSTVDKEHIYYIPVLSWDDNFPFEDENGEYIFNVAIDRVLTK